MELTKDVKQAYVNMVDRGVQYPEIEIGPGPKKLLWHLRYRTKTGPQSNEWDGYEQLAYLPECMRVKDELDADTIFVAIRALGPWRPSVPELRGVIDAAHGVAPPSEPLPGHVIESRRVVKAPTVSAIEPAMDFDKDAGGRARQILSALPGWSNAGRKEPGQSAREARRAHGHHDDPEDPIPMSMGGMRSAMRSVIDTIPMPEEGDE